MVLLNFKSTAKRQLPAQTPRRSLQVFLSALLGVSGVTFLTPFTIHAQAPNPTTALDCGAPPVTDTYSATEIANEDFSVGGPISCGQAQAIANSLNLVSGCCQHPKASGAIKLAEQRAESRCNDKKGSNFACDIFSTPATVCVDGCGLTTRPADNPLGCVADAKVTQCTGAARAVPTDREGEKCTVMCAVDAVATASGKFKIGCTSCASEENCDGSAQLEVRKREKITALEKRKSELEAQLAALNPNDPNYAVLARDILAEIAAIVVDLNKVVSFVMNVRKLLSIGAVPDKCGGGN